MKTKIFNNLKFTQNFIFKNKMNFVLLVVMAMIYLFYLN